LTQRINL